MCFQKKTYKFEKNFKFFRFQKDYKIEYSVEPKIDGISHPLLTKKEI